jgi:hypothetical protein
MSRDELEKILEKVRKLLALAGNNPNQHEATSAAEMAKRILNEYNLSLTDVELKEIVEKVVVLETLKLENWKGLLGMLVAKTFDCHAYVSRRKDIGVIRIVFVGNKTDAEVAYYVYDYLYRVINILIDKKVKNDGSMIHGNKIRKDYSYGIISVLGDRLKEFYGKEKEQNDVKVNKYGKTGKEILVIKEDAIAKYIREHVGKLKNRNVGKQTVDENLYVSGQKDGNKISLTHGIKYDGSGVSGYINA